MWRDWWEYKPQKIYLTLLFGTLAEQFHTLNHTDLSWVAYVDTCGDSDPLLVGPTVSSAISWELDSDPGLPQLWVHVSSLPPCFVYTSRGGVDI